MHLFATGVYLDFKCGFDKGDRGRRRQSSPKRTFERNRRGRILTLFDARGDQQLRASVAERQMAEFVDDDQILTQRRFDDQRRGKRKNP
jgi:hypothetical protein